MELSPLLLHLLNFLEIKYIVLTIYEDDDKIFQKPLKLEPVVICLKKTSINIVEAMKNVVQFDGIPMSPAIARRAMDLLRDTHKPTLVCRMQL